MADTCEHWTSETGYAKASLYAACPWCELKKLKVALLWIASMADEDNEWDGTERFRTARKKAIDALPQEPKT